VAQLRRLSNITQVQLAEALGVSQATITAYENGTRRVPASMLHNFLVGIRPQLPTLDHLLHRLESRGLRSPSGVEADESLESDPNK
jgi:transcriptional regulator with XRE-family HTH domain